LQKTGKGGGDRGREYRGLADNGDRGGGTEGEYRGLAEGGQGEGQRESTGDWHKMGSGRWDSGRVQGTGRKRGQRESTEDWQGKKKRSLAVSEVRNRTGRKYTQGLGGWFQSHGD
jgi:hypothetical protein